MARNYGRISEKIILDDGKKIRKYIRPSDRIRVGDTVIWDGDEFILTKEFEEKVEATVDGGIGQRIFSKTRNVFECDCSDVRFIVEYDSFGEIEVIQVNFKLDEE